MADLISFIQDEMLDDTDEGVFDQGDGPTSSAVDYTLPPLLRLKKHAFYDHLFCSRQMVPRVLVDIFRTCSPDVISKDLPQIMEYFTKLAEQDEDVLARTELIKQIPNVATTASLCAAQVPCLATVVSNYILPLIVHNLSTAENPVRNATHTALFVLLEQGLISKVQAEIQICPTVLALSQTENLMNYTGAVTLMSKMTTYLGREITERVFLDRFTQLCSNSMFCVRKVCASHFGDFCAVVSQTAFNNKLLPCFITMCSDEIWGVRKACAEVIMSVSCACTPETRRSVLAPVFVKLLLDESRWVCLAAFQALGPFISTFADGLIFDQSGQLAVNTSHQEDAAVYVNGVDFESPSYDKQTSDMLSNDLNLSFQSLDLSDLEITHNPLASSSLMSSSEGGGETKATNVKATDSNTDNNDSYTSKSTGKGIDEEFISSSGDANDQEDITELVETVKNAVLIFRKDSTGFTSESPKKVEDEINDDSSSDFTEKLASISVKTTPVNTAIFTSTNQKILNANSSSSNDSSALDDATLTIEKDAINCHSRGSSFYLENKTAALENKTTNFLDTSKNNKGAISSNSNGSSGEEEDHLKEFNCYNYWYIKPDLPVDPAIVDGIVSVNNETKETPNASVQSSDKSFSVLETSSSEIKVNSALDETTPVLPRGLALVHSIKAFDDNSLDVVPKFLVDFYVSMTDSNLAESIDSELAYHCAYSLPAVALTLGKKNWHLIANTVELLADDMQYKVRRTVASSLHELAIILGPEIATDSLAPIFDAFIKDLDEVRIGILRHLAHFLKLISPRRRVLYLPRLSEFLQTDNETNWRFRKELAEQLLLATPLFRPIDATKYIAPLAQELLCDKVAAVREVALLLVAELLRHVSADRSITPWLLVKLAEKFAHSKKWKRRQSFALLCAELLSSRAVSLEQFSSEAMPHLLDLSWDPVANVRIVVARTISKHVVTQECFMDPSSQHYDSLQTVLRRLQADKDRDVRHSANYQILK
ncbi:serine/threonine-protein phosphatase 4 regulatory subunit 1 isoform X3 [Agrilus planipennis]|uniref:Serine/threonine-protein phosphatase 4 regulatory subunit 1 isoform X3 n=1 Tax=Agrilus planipennis TaxID=224129 RepID=A0A1W4WN80_AGRPL|nr:serine/threonine-protein phosphatase 4 regulatory subunit 1 isoform X3 [Agrilus planipennis]